jgi:phosphoglycolate phosphatase-like HAD superfamily hydrolase
MLLLLDIDMTMISTGGCGMKAMTDTGRELFGPAFSTDGISFAGRLDPLIISDMLRKHGIEDAPERHRQFRSVYKGHLERRLATPNIGRSLPGVQELLAALSRRSEITLGVLTGNFEETGSMKLRACGIDPTIFAVAVWGDESPHHPPKREHLVPVAITRAERQRGSTLHPKQVVVIRDTPHDIHCARAHGCRSLGVATGHSNLDELRAAGADLALPDLSSTTSVLDWLLEPARTPA